MLYKKSDSGLLIPECISLWKPKSLCDITMFPMDHGILVAAAASAVTLTFTTSAIDATDGTTFTFAGKSLSTAAASRKIVVTIFGASATTTLTISTVTVAGVSATLVKAHQDVGGEEYVQIWQAAVPTGTTGDVVVTWSGSVVCCGIGIFAMYDAASAASATAGANNTPNPSVSLSIPANGAAIGVAGGAGTATWTWTNLTENYDAVVEGVQNHTGASKTVVAAETPTITATPSPSSAPCMALASWALA